MKMGMMIIALIAALMLSAGCAQQGTAQANNAPTGQPNQTSGIPPSEGSVAISGFAFSPSTITIKAGGTVTWTNNDPVVHTVTGTGFESGSIESGATYSHTFVESGTYDYGCSIHTSMRGTVIVK